MRRASGYGKGGRAVHSKGSATALKRAVAAPLDNTQYSRAGLVAANVLLFGPIALVLAPGLIGALAVLAVAFAALPRWLAAFASTRPRGRTPALHIWVIAAFMVWAIARLVWDGRPDNGAALALANILAIVLLGFVVGGDMRRAADRALVVRAAIAGIGIAAAVVALDALAGWRLLLEVAGGNDPIGFDAKLPQPPGASGMLAISALLPLGFAAAGLSARIGLWGWIGGGLIVLAMFGLTLLTAHWLGMAAWAIGAIMLAIGYSRSESMFANSALVGACLIGLSPWLLAPLAGFVAQGFGANLSPELAFDWVSRVKTWGFVADGVWQRPIIGWGLGASAQFTETYQLGGYSIPFITGYPHSAALQLWLEMGGIGVALACAALAAMGRRSGAALARDRFAAAAGASALSTGLVLVYLDADLWDPSLWTALALSAVMTRLFRDAA